MLFRSRNVWREIGEGLGVVLGNPLLRPIAMCTATWNLFSNILFAVFLLFLTRELGLDAGAIGLVFSFAGLGAVVGASLASRVAGALGIGPTIVTAALVGAATNLVVPLFAQPGPTAFWVIGGTLLTTGAVGVTYNITQLSLRQAIVPVRLQGRMNATMRFIVWGTLPIGSLIGGFLGEQIGLRPTMLVGALGGTLAGLWVLFSPVRSLREQPAPVD